MSSAVVPLVYRHIARLARLHDRDPALKALLHLVPSKEYDWHKRRWESCEVEPQRGLHAAGSCAKKAAVPPSCHTRGLRPPAGCEP